MCTWLIEAPFGYHVYLSISYFSLEYGGSNCPYDFLEIRDGNTLSSPLITKACGSVGYLYIYSSGRLLLLRFRTDGTVQGAGFAAYYSTVSYRKGYIYSFHFLILLIDGLSSDLEMKTHEQNKKKQRNRNRAIWLVYRTDTNAWGFWLVKRTLWWTKIHARELSRNQSIVSFDVILQHYWLTNRTIPFPKQRVYVFIFSSIGW